MSSNQARRSGNGKPTSKTGPARSSNTSISAGFREKLANQKRGVNTMQSKRPAQTNQPKIDKDEMEQYRTKLWDNLDFSEIPDEKLPMIHSYLRDFAAKSASDEKYDDAEKASQIAEAAQKEANERKNTKIRTRNYDGPEPNMEEFDKQCQNELDAFDQDTEKRISQLEENQNKEREEFEKKWREEKPQKYRKPSQRLLQLKQIEKTLANNEEYGRAKQVHQDVENLQSYELQVAQESIIRDYNIASQSLTEKHNKEKENLIQSRELTRNLVITRQASERNAQINREKVIKARLAENPRIRPNVTGSPVTRSVTRKDTDINDVLLPPLRAPNDPELVEETKRKQREENKKKLAFQKKNAEQTLAKVSLGSTYDEEELAAYSSQQRSQSRQSSNEQLANKESPTKPKEEKSQEEIKIGDEQEPKEEVKEEEIKIGSPKPEENKDEQTEHTGQPEGGLLSNIITDTIEDSKQAPPK